MIGSVAASTEAGPLSAGALSPTGLSFAVPRLTLIVTEVPASASDPAGGSVLTTVPSGSSLFTVSCSGLTASPTSRSTWDAASTSCPVTSGTVTRDDASTTGSSLHPRRSCQRPEPMVSSRASAATSTAATIKVNIRRCHFFCRWGADSDSGPVGLFCKAVGRPLPTVCVTVFGIFGEQPYRYSVHPLRDRGIYLLRRA